MGSSHYLLPRLVKSEANWENGNNFWYKSCIKLGIMGISLTILTMILGEYFKLFDPLIIFIPVSLGMIYMCIRMEKDILKD